MGKIDPKQLLGLFSQDLTAEGGIRNDKDTLEKLSGYVVAVLSSPLDARCVPPARDASCRQPATAHAPFPCLSFHMMIVPMIA